MDIEKEREAFDAWYCKNHTGLKQSDLAKFRTLSGYSFSDSLKINISWEAWQAAKAQAVLEVKPSRHVTLTCAQLREAFMFGAPDKDDQEQLETEMTITWSENGHSGKGYYCYYSDLPEEGAIFLDDVIEAQEPANDL